MKPRLLAGITGLLLGASLCAEETPPELIRDRNIVFLPARTQGPALALDIIRPRAPGRYPGVVLIPGGDFHGGDRSHLLPLAVKLARAGYLAATVDYRLTPRFQFPSQLHDVKAAVRFLRVNAARFGLLDDRICAVGASSGGTLALLLGLTGGVTRFEGWSDYREASSSVGCVVNLNGGSDMTITYANSRDAAETLPPLLGGRLPSARAAYLEASPVHWVTPAAAPVLSIHGKSDRNAYYQQSLVLQQRFQAAGVEAEVKTVEEADTTGADRIMIRFLDRHLKPARDRWTVLLSDHGPAGQLVAMGWPSGKILWQTPNDRGLDVQALPDGHVLFTRDAKSMVVEIDERRNVVWSAGPERGLKKPYSAQRLANGNTLVGDADGARVIELSPQGKAVWKWAKPEMAELWPRMVRRTDKGTTLVTYQKAGVILEINSAGETVWQYKTEADRLPYQALRLANGNTLIGLVDPGEAIEVETTGKIVRSVGGKKGDVRLSWIAGMAVLPNAGLMLADFTSRRLVEVDAGGNLVHEVRDLPWSVASIAVAPVP